VKAGLVLAFVALGLGCRDQTAPASSPKPAPRQGALKPLTSRDGDPGADAPSLPPGHPPLLGSPIASPAKDALAGVVALEPKFHREASPGEALFIIARNSATHQILAVKREQDVRFPHEFEISGADAMMAGTSFAGPFDLTARLSKTGDAMPSTGDLEGTTRSVPAGSRHVSILIDTAHP